MFISCIWCAVNSTPGIKDDRVVDGIGKEVRVSRSRPVWQIQPVVQIQDQIVAVLGPAVDADQVAVQVDDKGIGRQQGTKGGTVEIDELDRVELSGGRVDHGLGRDGRWRAVDGHALLHLAPTVGQDLGHHSL